LAFTAHSLVYPRVLHRDHASWLAAHKTIGWASDVRSQVCADLRRNTGIDRDRVGGACGVIATAETEGKQERGEAATQKDTQLPQRDRANLAMMNTAQATQSSQPPHLATSSKATLEKESGCQHRKGR
jgi:hypothetical protein